MTIHTKFNRGDRFWSISQDGLFQEREITAIEVYLNRDGTISTYLKANGSSCLESGAFYTREEAIRHLQNQIPEPEEVNEETMNFVGKHEGIIVNKDLES